MANQATDAGVKSERDAARMADIRHAVETDLTGALTLAAQAKADGLANAYIHHLLGIGLRQQGRFEEAIVELGEGLKLEPQNARLMTEVGFCLLELGRRREAAHVMGAALKLDPESPDANFGYGWAAERLGSLDAAESGFKRAVAFNPNHADAVAGLSGLAVRRREWDAARDYAERAYAIDPGQTDALLNLARIDIGQGRLDDAQKRLKAFIALPQLNPQARTNARLLLGDALDGAKRYADAFAAYAEGKSETREQYAHLYEGANANAASNGVRDILAEFRGTPAQASARPAALPERGDLRGHAFLLGFPRSGTTLMEQVLATHPDVVALGERPVLIDAEIEFLINVGGVKRLAGASSEVLDPFRRSYWQRVSGFGVQPSGKVFIDKHPLSTFRLPLISKMFPEAKIIFALRDPRDVVLSCFRRGFDMNASMYEFTGLERAARFYDAVMGAGQVYMTQLPLDVHRLRYEDLVVDFEGAAGALCDFLGIARTERLRDFAETAASSRIATPSSAQVGRGLYGEGVGHWRNYADALAPALPILKPWIEAFGYDPD